MDKCPKCERILEWRDLPSGKAKTREILFTLPDGSLGCQDCAQQKYGFAGDVLADLNRQRMSRN